MRPKFVVLLSPGFKDFLCCMQTGKPILIQTLIRGVLKVTTLRRLGLVGSLGSGFWPEKLALSEPETEKE